MDEVSDLCPVFGARYVVQKKCLLSWQRTRLTAAGKPSSSSFAFQPNLQTKQESFNAYLGAFTVPDYNRDENKHYAVKQLCDTVNTDQLW